MAMPATVFRAVWLSAICLLACVVHAQERPVAALDIKVPRPPVIPTPRDFPANLPNLEKRSQTPRPPFLAPVGATNLAFRRPVSSSDPEPIAGQFKQITDGDKDNVDESRVELNAGVQWVRIDLGKQAEIFAVIVWHQYSDVRVYKSVVVQVAEDPDFTTGVTTIYNNDFDNTLGSGAGTDPLYFESFDGRLIDAKGAKGRYVRLYSNGSTSDDLNHYTEVEVWGLPVK
jgi:hypothetical protein